MPGNAVAIVAGLAAAMSIHTDMKGWQKAFWMILMGVFVVLELKSIKTDRIESMRTQTDIQLLVDTFSQLPPHKTYYSDSRFN